MLLCKIRSYLIFFFLYLKVFLKFLLCYISNTTFRTTFFEYKLIVPLKSSFIKNNFFHISYHLFSSKLSLLELNLLSLESSNPIKRVKIDESNYEIAVDFFIKIYCRQFPFTSSKSHMDDLTGKLKVFLLESNQSYLYFLNFIPIGILGVYEDMHHPLLKGLVNHIGVIGYDNQVLLKDQIKALKHDWNSLLKTISANNRSFTTRIEAFNTSSLNFFNTLNFRPIFMEFKKDV